MITEKAIRDAFGTKVAACKQITCSRVTLDKWIDQGFISEECRHGLAAGKNWHEIIKKLGFSPTTLKPL